MITYPEMMAKVTIQRVFCEELERVFDKFLNYFVGRLE